MVLAAHAQQMDPDFEKALQAQKDGETDRAITLYRAFLKKKPASFEAHANLGVLLVRQGFFDEAIAEYKAALKSAPSNPGLSYNLALAYYKRGDLTQAASELSTLRALVGDQPQVNLLLGDTYLQLEEYKKAIQLLEPEAKRRPDDLGVAYVLGMALVGDKRLEEGQILLNKILGQGETAEAMLLLGTSKYIVGDFAGSIVDFEKALKLNPELPRLYAAYGQSLMNTGDTPKAAEAFVEELKRNPNDFLSNWLLGILRKQEDKNEEALQLFHRALRVRPGDLRVRYQIAAIRVAENQVEPALKELESIVKEAPAFTEAHVSLATVYYRLKRKEDGDRERAIVQKLNAEAQEKQPKGKPIP